MSDTIIEKENILGEVFKLLGERYPRGLYEWLYIHDRGTYDEINRLENRVNENFLNRGSINDLKYILREYWQLHVQAIRSFRCHCNSGIPLNKIREERIREMEQAHSQEAAQ